MAAVTAIPVVLEANRGGNGSKCLICFFDAPGFSYEVTGDGVKWDQNSTRFVITQHAFNTFILLKSNKSFDTVKPL